MTNIYVTDFSEFSENIKGKLKCYEKTTQGVQELAHNSAKRVHPTKMHVRKAQSLARHQGFGMCCHPLTFSNTGRERLIRTRLI